MADHLDIDMDLDLDCSEHVVYSELALAASPPDTSNSTAAEPILSHPNDTSDPKFMQPLPHKVHLRGLENLSTADIETFAHGHFPQHQPSQIEWIDDTSANLVYPSASVALEALESFTSLSLSDIEKLATLQTIPTKPCTQSSPSILHARLAVFGDRKQSGARERSRFYLLHPEYDPAERRKRDDIRGRNRHSDRHSVDRRQRSNRRRRDHSLSSSDTHQRNPGGKSSKELFPDRSGSDYRRLRQRSASPVRDIGPSQIAESSSSRLGRRGRDNKGTRSPAARELFPQKCFPQRSGAFDETDESISFHTRDTAVASLNEIVDSQTDASLASSASRKHDGEMSRTKMQRSGAGTGNPSFEFAIKGAASGVRVKELFPDALGTNSGKELFAQILDGRGQRRKTAKDLFC
ncbi:unnamed protein product [Blumeria hordei]|uniref:Uncharacterized protein n=2 Tax=Blumeria hordei TaxID=2867405 RepID=A0A383UQH0_BLUHO|nr:hypothetical protein BGHDH14_bgh00389 [Blumeria hordei DH14]SZF01600.1 unnamed protein product [Blumeria hordei]